MTEESMTSMDRPRRRGSRRARIIGVVTVAIVAIAAVFGTRALARKPRSLKVDRATVSTGVVGLGEMRVQIHGNGTLVAEEARWLSAQTTATVERVRVEAGGAAEPATIILELSNPEAQQRAVEAELALRAAEAEAVTISEQWASQVLTNEAEVAAAEAGHDEARLRLEADRALLVAGLLPAINMSISEGAARKFSTERDVARAKLASAKRMREAAIAQQNARLEQLRAARTLRAAEAEALRVRAGIAGVVQRIAVEAGQQVGPGTALALLADPRRLKAQILVPETQAKDVHIGQRATVDTRAGIVTGVVARVDPAARNGSVVVDIHPSGLWPAGARPDLNVDGTIDIERIARAINVDRPAVAASGATTLFRLTADGAAAIRTPVRLGRISATRVEILSGLGPGDVVITSEVSEWDGVDRIEFD